MSVNITFDKEEEKTEKDIIDIPIDTIFTGILYNKLSSYKENYVLFINTYDRVVCFRKDGSFTTHYNKLKDKVLDLRGLVRDHLVILDYKPVSIDIKVNNE